MAPEDIEALIRLLDDPRLGWRAEAQLVEIGARAIPALHAYADLAPTIANEILKQIYATDTDIAWGRLAQNPDVEAGALLLAASIDAFLDRTAITKQLDDLAHPLRGAVPTENVYYQRDALALRDWISYAKRFRANKGDYYAPDNLLLPKVIETRMGVPLSLCLIYLLVGRRLGAPVYIIELPQHHVLRYGDDPHAVYIDPFHNGVLMSEKECRTAAMRVGAPLPDSAFLPMSDYDVIERLLRALAVVYKQRGDAKLEAQMEHYRAIWRDAVA